MIAPRSPFEPPQFSDVANRRKYAAISRAIDVWAESIKRLADQPDLTEERADLEGAITNAFRFAERLLETQRQLTLDLVRTLTTGESPVDPAEEPQEKDR